MDRFLLLPLIFASALAQADISCTAHQFEVTNKGLINEIEKPLAVDYNQGTVLQMSVDIGGRSYSLSGDTKNGDFLVTQSWGEEYTSGINTTASFNSSGRLQISQVDGAKVFKLECKKVGPTP